MQPVLWSGSMLLRMPLCNGDKMMNRPSMTQDFTCTNPAASILTPDTLYHSQDVAKYDYDPETAKKLLSAAV